jgi:DNA-binding MarR family transcriptional regulator
LTEAAAFEREYPGASWLAVRVTRELEIVGGLVEAVVAGIARRHGLSHAALNALAVIEGAGGPVPAGEVSARMHITSGTMTSVLDTLERKGYIERQADSDDRRRVLVDITPAAEAVLDRVLPDVVVGATAMLDGLGEERLSALLDGLAAVRERVAAVPDELPPAPARRRPEHLQRRR